MATRQQTAQRRSELLDHVRTSIREGLLTPGDSLPSLPELADRFGLSRETVRAVLHGLVADGVLTAEPRRGLRLSSFASFPSDRCFVLVIEDKGPQNSVWPKNHMVRNGFERRITERGGISMCQGSTTLQLTSDVAGVFRFGSDASDAEYSFADGAPLAWYGWRNPAEGPSHVDHLRFDNVGGGADATRHLIDRGHRRIAFLGRYPLHEESRWGWARDRLAGWRNVMARRLPDEPMVCLHAELADLPRVSHVRELGEIVAERAVERRAEFDALVAVDDWAVESLLTAWRRHGLPSEEFPAIVSFEDLPEARSPFVTSVKVPWERLGEAAADLLWQRAVGQITGPSVHRLVPMEVAVRLSSGQFRRSDAMAALLADPF